MKEKIYNERLEELQKFHHRFWVENNVLFDECLNRLEKEKKATGTKKLDPEEIACFYCDYLENSSKRHREYNYIWLKNNIKLLPISIVANVTKMLRTGSSFLDSLANFLTLKFSFRTSSQSR